MGNIELLLSHWSDFSGNGQQRISGNPLLHKVMGTQTKIVKIFFRMLDINYRLTIIQEGFIEEKWLNHGKNNELCVILISLLTSPSFHMKK